MVAMSKAAMRATRRFMVVGGGWLVRIKSGQAYLRQRIRRAVPCADAREFIAASTCVM